MLQAVDQTIAYASAHSEQFNLKLEQVRTLAESIVIGVADFPEDPPSQHANYEGACTCDCVGIG